MGVERNPRCYKMIKLTVQVTVFNEIPIKNCRQEYRDSKLGAPLCSSREPTFNSKQPRFPTCCNSVSAEATERVLWIQRLGWHEQSAVADDVSGSSFSGTHSEAALYLWPRLPSFQYLQLCRANNTILTELWAISSRERVNKYGSQHIRPHWLHTIEKLGALRVAFLHFLALVCGSLHVTVGHSKHSCSWLHQELTHLDIVTGGSTMQWGPGKEGTQLVRNVSPNSRTSTWQVICEEGSSVSYLLASQTAFEN